MLKLKVREWWHDRRIRAVSAELAPDLGVPADVVKRVLDQTTAELQQLAAQDEASDVRPVINKAIEELTKHGGYQVRSADEELMDHYLKEVPDRDYTILRHFKQGKKHREIAALMGTDVESVRRSLVKTYADLRMKMRSRERGRIRPPQDDQQMCAAKDKRA